MGDFLLDFRPLPERRMKAAAAVLKFCNDLHLTLIEQPEFSLLLTTADEPRLWGHFQSEDGEILAAVCGRLAFDEPVWMSAQQTAGRGGLVGKAIYNLYREGGADALRHLNGNFVVFLLDRRRRDFLMATDRCGMMVVYGGTPLESTPVFSSHPDALASVTDQDRKWDWTSLAEFLMTGRLTFPWTYYSNIRGLEPGTLYRFTLKGDALEFQSQVRYAGLDYHGSEPADEEELAAELALAFQKAVRRRTLPLLGNSCVALSGGLDSRLILSATAGSGSVHALTLYDEMNPEFRTAAALAKAGGVGLTSIQRDFDYYGRTMEAGVNISGGVGCIASNHFLGIRDWINQTGTQNLLTGCYCDYLFKGLALNTAERKFSRRETLADFRFEFYRPLYWLNSPQRDAVHARLRDTFPEAGRPKLSAEDWSRVERKRSFPLAYEADLTQRVIPQRVMPWYPPIVDNDVMEVYRKIPSQLKLNAAIFKKAVWRVCSPALRRIPDSNTGAPLNTGPLRYAIHRYASALQNRIHHRLLPRMATRGSWPNWEYYLPRSPMIARLWTRNQSAAKDFLTPLVGRDPYAKPLSEYRGRDAELFLRLLTLKLWAEQRDQTYARHSAAELFEQPA